MHERLIRSPENEESGESPSRNTLRYIMLGLLWIRPMSGYDIKQAFERAIASYWNAGNSQIYTTLKNLHKAGLIDAEIIVQTSRPNRKVYRLTQAGHNELERWMHEEIPERFTKDEFLTKLFFCGTTSDEIVLEHLREHRESLLKQLAHMEWARREYGSRHVRRPKLLEYQLLVRDYKEAELRAGLEVTEQAIKRLEERLQQQVASLLSDENSEIDGLS
ncbi:MAG TPA: PadR family transcriptional regulator [Dictyobacter sp.]|jgi:DNA-binding PadR family transcriptional regulator|nr:PadR family transcriptional regulator [Dictyobacter sp.]